MFGVGMGPDSNEKQSYGNLSSAAGFATNLGEHDLSEHSRFLDALLSGDSTAISKLLAPQIAGVQERAQQQRQNVGEFGGRSGGTTAAVNASGDRAAGDVNNMITGLTSGALASAGSTGANLLGTGMMGHQAAFNEAKTMHDQTLAKWNDLFGSIGNVAGVVGSFIPGPWGKVLKGAAGVLQDNNSNTQNGEE